MIIVLLSRIGGCCTCVLMCTGIQWNPLLVDSPSRGNLYNQDIQSCHKQATVMLFHLCNKETSVFRTFLEVPMCPLYRGSTVVYIMVLMVLQLLS